MSTEAEWIEVRETRLEWDRDQSQAPHILTLRDSSSLSRVAERVMELLRRPSQQSH
jgi:hypothetical protein